MKDFIVRRFAKDSLQFDFYQSGQWTGDAVAATKLSTVAANKLIEKLNSKSDEYIYSTMFRRQPPFAGVVNDMTKF